MTEPPRYFGKYRGVVTDADDRLGQGRVQVRVPDTTGEHASTWALPCVPIGGPGYGFYAVPRVGDHVWIEYEYGDLRHPIWVGCFWSRKDDLPRPAQADPPAAAVWLTPGNLGLFVRDGDQPALVLLGPSGARITLDATGIEITNGHAVIKLASGNVTINDGALEVR